MNLFSEKGFGLKHESQMVWYVHVIADTSKNNVYKNLIIPKYKNCLMSKIVIRMPGFKNSYLADRIPITGNVNLNTLTGNVKLDKQFQELCKQIKK